MIDEGLQFEDAEPEDGQDIPQPESEGLMPTARLFGCWLALCWSAVMGW